MGIFSTGISPELKAFIEAVDLDELLQARSKLRQLDEKDMKKIRFILQKWNNPQAVSNLLFHPFLIPPAIRANCLLKGLRERKNPYYVLASVSGFRELIPQDFLKRKGKQ